MPSEPKPLQRTRRQFRRDHAYLRRARSLYAALVRRWIEQAKDPRWFRARLFYCAERAVERGLYAQSTGPRQAMFGLLSQWRLSDRMPWWPWMRQDERRNSVADWSIKTSSIRYDARRLHA